MEKAQELFEAAVQAEEAGDSDRAIRLYQESSLLAPTVPHPKVRLAILLLQGGKWDHAIRVGRQLIKRWPRVQIAYCVTAQSYARLGRWLMAERFYRKALAIEEDPNLLVLYGFVLSQLERNDEAAECLRKALETDPDNEEAHYNLGRIYKITGKPDIAEKHLKQAIQINPKYTWPYAELGQLLSAPKKGRTKEAIPLLRKAIKYNPDDGWSIAYLANALWTVRKLKAADEQYRRLMKLWPDEPLPYCLYGDFLASERNEGSTAEWYLRKAVEIDPEAEDPNYYLGKHLLYWDRDEEARKFLTKAARLGHAKARELLQLSFS
jgi:tetratricopeptide (TPR) repeat protein